MSENSQRKTGEYRILKVLEKEEKKEDDKSADDGKSDTGETMKINKEEREKRGGRVVRGTQ